MNLVEAMAIDLREGVSVALGLEAPLFLPVGQCNGSEQRASGWTR